MLRPPPACGRDISLRWNSGPEPRPPYMPPPLLFTRSAAPPPDCGVKCRQLPLLVEALDWGEFPGRATLLDVVPGPADRFIEPSRCAGVESENRRHPELSEFVGRAIPPLLAGEDSVPRAGA